MKPQMNEISLLRDTLRCYFPWHGARLNFLAQFLIALYRVKTVNLAEIALGLIDATQTDSHLDRASLAQAVMMLMALPQP